MSIHEAEEILAVYRSRESAELSGDVAAWDEAYQVAYGAYRAERNFEVR